MKKNQYFIFLALCLFVIFGYGQQPDPKAITYANTITLNELKGHLAILASDEYGGRGAAEFGEDLASHYLAVQFREMGLPEVNGSYYQEFGLDRSRKSGNAKVAGVEYFLLDDFVHYKAAEQELEVKELVFCGYGINEKNYNDYEGVEVAGKAVIIYNGEPGDKDGNSLITGKQVNEDVATNFFEKIKVAGDGEVKLLFVVIPGFDDIMEPYKNYFGGIKMSLKGKKGSAQDGPMVFLVSKEMAAEIFKAGKVDPEKILSKISKKKAPQSFTFTTDIWLDTRSEKSEVISKNVLGFIEGSDLKDEILVITAHYDHLGLHDGKIYNGADDNGTGTVGLIEIAEAFAQAKKEGNGPRRSILVMPVSAEEKGLLGSAYYANNPVFPLENTIANLNIDMIGRNDKSHAESENYIYVIGADRLSQDLHDINEWANENYVGIDLDYTYNAEDDPNQFYYRSDHYNFAKKNVPAIFYFSGVHEDYHKETDTFDKILFDRALERTKLVFFTAWHLANADERPSLNDTSD